jgi:hypothetical protein
MNWEDHSPIEWQAAKRQARWYEWLLVLLLLGLAGGVRAATVYKCTDAGGGVAYQTLPCSAQQSEAVVPIAAAPAYAKSPEYAIERTTEPRERAAYASRHEPQAMSFECRAADGQVFYRHASCPHSVAGDGSATGSAAHRTSRGSGGSVPVSSSRIPRDEACREIHAAGSIGRAGHQHDENVSTYEHNLGRDPCR